MSHLGPEGGNGDEARGPGVLEDFRSLAWGTREGCAHFVSSVIGVYTCDVPAFPQPPPRIPLNSNLKVSKARSNSLLTHIGKYLLCVSLPKKDTVYTGAPTRTYTQEKLLEG